MLLPLKQKNNTLGSSSEPRVPNCDFTKKKTGAQSFCINAPTEIKEAPNLKLAKKLIKKYSKTMPI